MKTSWKPLAFAAMLLTVAFCLPVAAQPDDPLAKGRLIAVGGAMRDPAILHRFIKLAGGPDAPIIVIPTAGAGEEYDSDWVGLRAFRAAGAKNLRVLHTRDRKVADSEEFVTPLRTARGVFIAGGRQTRLAKAYLDTRTHRELRAVLERGGVVGGSSAGASILASFLVRGDTRSNTIVAGEYARGFGLLPNSAIDQHVLKRNRQFDLVPVIRAHPELLGIGIDEDTAIVISGDEFEVIGQSYVIIHDARSSSRNTGTTSGAERPASSDSRAAPARARDHASDSPDARLAPGAVNDASAPALFYFLAPGDHFNLKTRQATRYGRAFNPLPRPEPADRALQSIGSPPL